MTDVFELVHPALLMPHVRHTRIYHGSDYKRRRGLSNSTSMFHYHTANHLRDCDAATI
jgi:hypothetical protein